VVEQVSVKNIQPRRGRSGLLAEDALVRMVLDVRDATVRAWSEGQFPLVVAGDCPALLGGLIGMQQPGGGGLVFVDGHEDAWPPQLGTGEASDSEVALALGLYAGPVGLTKLLPCLVASRLLMLGPRDASEIEKAGAESIRARVPFRDATWLGSGAVETELGPMVDDTAGRASAGWWFHVDLDVLSTEALAAVDYPQPGGISWLQLDCVTDIVLDRPGCRGASVVIYNPDLDGADAAPRINDFLTHVVGVVMGK
jgi:arginase